jgi:multidrug efflux pump subunit AcrA (membrane-fusion protein)
VERASATRAQAEADLDSAAAQLQRAELDLTRTKILAPFDGRVRQKSVGLGQAVGPATALGDIFTVDFAEVRLPISGKQLQFLDLPELADDPPVEVELRNAITETSDTVWKAKIVRTEGVLDANFRELFAIARVDDPFGRKSGHPPLRIEQPVVARIVGQVLTDVVALPRVAVRQLDQVNLVDKTTLTLIPKTIDPIWSDEDDIIVRDPDIQPGMLLSTTHLVY